MAGIVRNVDDLGRAVIPIEFRRVLGIGAGDEVEISLENGIVEIRKNTKGCVICSNKKNVNYKIAGRDLCKNCRDKIKEL